MGPDRTWGLQVRQQETARGHGTMATDAGLWIRVSTADQSEANQIPDVERHCEARGYQVVPACRYELHDKSASKGQQDAELARMLADVQAGRIKVLVCCHS